MIQRLIIWTSKSIKSGFRYWTIPILQWRTLLHTVSLAHQGVNTGNIWILIRNIHTYIKTKNNSMVWARERTIPTERPPLVGEVIAKFLGIEGARGQRDGSLHPYSRFSIQQPLLFYQVAPQLYLRGWVDPVSDPLFFFWLNWESNPGLRICSQELWPVGHSGG
jgi:hypothetical protein